MRLPKSNKILAMKYSVGLSQFQNRVAKIKLSANESALGPSPKAIREYLRLSKNFKRYPDSEGVNLRKAIAKKFKLNTNKIILGSGSDQILELICKAFLKKGDEVVVPKYSFLIYRLYSQINGAKILYSKEKNLKVSVDDILKKVTKKTKIVFLANPNNPTSTYIDKKKLVFLRNKLRSNILLVVDDAYFEYVKQKNYFSGLQLFSNFKNVIITRTFSKIYGLAGLRVGWGYGSKEIINSLNQLKPPFNINSPGLSAAEVAVQDNAWLNKEIKHIKKWNDKFYKEFKKLNIETNKSFTNFLLINFDKVKKNSSAIFKLLANAGILVRKMNNYGIKNSLRVTIGKNDENKKLILKLKRVINV